MIFQYFKAKIKDIDKSQQTDRQIELLRILTTNSCRSCKVIKYVSLVRYCVCIFTSDKYSEVLNVKLCLVAWFLGSGAAPRSGFVRLDVCCVHPKNIDNIAKRLLT